MLLDRFRPRYLLVGILSAVCLGIIACSSQSTTEEMSSDLEPWYNQPGFKSVFGDFEPGDPLYIRDRVELERLVNRGEYLAVNVAACGSCHGAQPGRRGAPLSGGRLMSDRFGEVRAANITPDSETGIGGWDFAHLVRAVRGSLDKNGRPLSLDLHGGYRWMSDEDAKSIALYLLSLPPVKNSVERRELGGFERNKWGFIPLHENFRGYVPSMPSGPTASYGRYLAINVARCASCHSSQWGKAGPDFAGPSRKRGLISGLLSLASILTPSDHEVDDQSVALLSPEAQAQTKEQLPDRKPDNQPQASEEELLEALRSGQFPLMGPDIRGSSEGGIGRWSDEQIVTYLTNGKGPDGKPRDGRFCPWPFFSGMKETERRAIVLYLRTLS